MKRYDDTDEQMMDALLRDLFGFARVLIVAVALVIAFLVMIARPASAHGDAQWIIDNPATYYCCGPQDCTVIPASIVKPIAGGYTVFWNGKWWPFQRDGKDKFSERRVWPSERASWWMCVKLDRDNPGIENGDPRCLFEPPLW